MKTTQSFLIESKKTVKQAMRQMSELGIKELFVVDQDQRLIGALSDGDIRKWILKRGSLSENVFKVCNPRPVFVEKNYQPEFVKERMLTLKIESIPVVTDTRKIINVLSWDDVFVSSENKPRGVLDTDVVIMAGGRGARLDPFTRILPKPLIPIGNKPIVEIIMERFYEYGVREFHITLNHKSKMIKYYLEETKDKFKVHFIEEKTPLGTAGGLKILGSRVSDPFIVTNCDVLIETDYQEIVQYHKENKYDLTLVASYRHYVIPYGVCELKNGGELRAIKEKPEYDLFVNTGMYVMNKVLLKLIPKNQAFDITTLIEKAKSHKFRVGVFPINEKSWIDIGQWKEYHEAIEKLKVESV